MHRSPKIPPTNLTTFLNALSLISMKNIIKETKTTQLTVTIKEQIVHDLKVMEKNTHQSVDDLVTKALLFFIATHNDYLGRNRLM